VVPFDREDSGALVRPSRTQDHRISHIAARQEDVSPAFAVLPVEIVDVRYDQQLHLLFKPRTCRPRAGAPHRTVPGWVSGAAQVKQKTGVIASITDNITDSINDYLGDVFQSCFSFFSYLGHFSVMYVVKGGAT
jgi:hypothetical protein